MNRISAFQTVLILDDDIMITDGLAAGLERRGRNTVTRNDIESVQLALEWVAPTHIVSDIHISGTEARLRRALEFGLSLYAYLVKSRVL
jgi:ActR/RegA family two-component response regulator